jgi:phosphatidylglycerophosphate synthase
LDASLAAAVKFASAREADRPVAGVPVAARLVRELAEAGYSHAWLVLPDHHRLASRTEGEIARLAGSMTIHRSTVVPPDAALTLYADELVPAVLLRGRGTTQDVLEDGALIPLGAANATALLLKTTGKLSDGPVSRWINRPISRRISALLLNWPGIRPLHATICCALLGIFMFAAFTLGGARGLILGGLLFHAASLLDGVDGEIARATFRTSDQGAALDSAIDMAMNLFFVLGLTINLGAEDGGRVALAGGCALTFYVIGGAIIAWRGRHQVLSFDHTKHCRSQHLVSGTGAILLKAGTIITSRDFFALGWMLIILAGFGKPLVYLIALVVAGWFPIIATAPLLFRQNGRTSAEPALLRDNAA